MKYRIPDLILIVLLVLGAGFAWQSSRERGRLASDYERLSKATGDLPIADPTKAHFLALPTGEPLHFAWRVYLPAHASMVIRSRTGTSGVNAGGDPREFIARVRLREDEQGYWYVYQSFQGGSSRANLDGKELATLLRGRADRVLVEQLGAKGVAAVKPDGPAVLLRLSLPREMQAEARNLLPAYEQGRFIPDLFLLEIGPEKPKPAPPPSGN